MEEGKSTMTENEEFEFRARAEKEKTSKSTKDSITPKNESLVQMGERMSKVDPESIFGQVQQGAKIGFQEVGEAGKQYLAGGVSPEQETRLKGLQQQKQKLGDVGKAATYLPEAVATIPAMMAAPAIGTGASLAALLGTTGLSQAIMRPVEKETKGGKDFIKEKTQQVVEGVKGAEEGLLLGLGIFKGIPAVGKTIGEKFVGGKTQPAITDLAKKWEDKGLILDPAQLRPEKPISSPGYKTKAQLNNEKILTKEATKETGLETENITPEYLQSRKDKLSKNYDKIFNRNFEIDKPFVDKLQEISDFEKRVNPAGSRQIIGTAQNLVNRYQEEALTQQLQQIQQRIKNTTRKQGPMIGGIPQGVRKKFPTLYQKGEANAPEWMDDVTNSVNELSESLGLPKPPRVFAGKGPQSGLYGLATGDGDLIVIKHDLDRNGAIATGLHEFGHNVEFQLFAYAPQATQKEIMAAYLNQKASLPKGGLTTEQHRPITAEKYGVGVRDLPAVGTYETYLRNFNEWFAEQTSRWITTNQTPTNTVEKFFKGVADVWKAIYARVKGSIPLVQEVDQFFRSNWKGNLINDIVPPNTFADTPMNLGDITAKIPGTELQRLRSNLRDVANTNTDGAIREAARNFVTQIDAMVGRDNPQLLEALIDTNRKYAATMTLANGIEKGFVTQGKISAEGLGNHLAQQIYGYGLGTTNHPLYDLGYAGQQLKLSSRAEGTTMQPAVGFGAKTKALGRLLGTGMGSRTQVGRDIQRRISEQ
jgi:hypothetical protein